MPKRSDNSKPEGITTPSGLPLLYRRPVALDALRHLQASISTETDYSFAKSTNSLPLNAIEFVEAAKTYPIVFSGGDVPMPVAIVGLEQENYFVKKDNSWQKNTYIPAYVRQYPFIFSENPKDKKLYLCVDEATPRFSKAQQGEANMLYNKQGDPTEFTRNAMKFCTSFYQHHLVTRNFCADLRAHKLLQPYHSEAILSSGKKAKLSGFQMIDEKVLNELPNKAFLALRDKGWMPFIYLALASVSNWKMLAAMESKSE